MTENKTLEEAAKEYAGGKINPWPLFGYAPGNYMNICAVCNRLMQAVDKLCFMCLECAVIEVHKLIASSHTGVRWVKASERLPERDYNYFVKATSKHQGYNHNDTALFKNGVWIFRGSNYEVVEWLDESPESLPTDGDEERSLRQQIANILYKGESVLDNIMELLSKTTIPMGGKNEEIIAFIKESERVISKAYAESLIVRHEQQKEIERLKGLIEKLYREKVDKMPHPYDYDPFEDLWNDFKQIHNL